MHVVDRRFCGVVPNLHQVGHRRERTVVILNFGLKLQILHVEHLRLFLHLPHAIHLVLIAATTGVASEECIESLRGGADESAARHDAAGLRDRGEGSARRAFKFIAER